MNDFDKERISILFLNGGGQPSFSIYHRLVKYFTQFNCNLISVELPGHGKSNFDYPIEVNEILDIFKKEFFDLINNAKLGRIALVGFSLGGLLSLKAIEFVLHPIEFVIISGCGVKIEPEQKKIIDYYTTEEFFAEKNWIENMKKYHDNGWPVLIHSIHKWFDLDSQIFTPVELLARSKIPIHFLFGDMDEVFNPEVNSNVLENQSNIHVKILKDTAHFDYFDKSWPIFKKYLVEMENKLHLQLKQ